MMAQFPTTALKPVTNKTGLNTSVCNISDHSFHAFPLESPETPIFYVWPSEGQNWANTDQNRIKLGISFGNPQFWSISVLILMVDFSLSNFKEIGPENEFTNFLSVLSIQAYSVNLAEPQSVWFER